MNRKSQTCKSQAPTHRADQRSKIAVLPKEQRDAINNLLLDGASYSSVINRMAEQGISLNSENVSKWYQSGFQDYLASLERFDQQRAKYEAANDLLQNIDASKIPEAGLQTAAAQIYDLLDKFAPDDIAAAMANEPDKYIRIVNALSRLTREALAIKKYTDYRSRAALRNLDINRKLKESEDRIIVRKVDEVFGLASISDPPADEVSSSDLSGEQLSEAGSPADERSQPPPCPTSALPPDESSESGSKQLPRPAGHATPGSPPPACRTQSTAATVEPYIFPGDAEGSDLPWT